MKTGTQKGVEDIIIILLISIEDFAGHCARAIGRTSQSPVRTKFNFSAAERARTAASPTSSTAGVRMIDTAADTFAA